MGLVKKMDWLKWIRKYSGILQDTKTGSMETLIDSASSKSINYAYTSSVIAADDESINATAAPPHQRPMLPPPNNLQESPTEQQLPNDVYDCCVSLDGIPIKQEFQYTLSDVNGCGKIAKHDIEGLASKILESMYGTALNSSSRGQRTVKVTLNIRQSTGVQVDCTTATMTPSWGHHHSGRERKHHKSSTDRRHHARSRTMVESEPTESDCLIYGISGSPMHYKLKSGADIYRRDQLVEMVEKSLAENLSFQNLREAQNRPEGYHRTRTRRRQSSASAGEVQHHAAAVPSPAAKPMKPPPKVAWSPYDFEPVAHVPSHYHHQHHHHNQHQHQHQYLQYERQRNHRSQQRALYGKTPVRAAVTVEEHVVKLLNSGARPQRRVATTTAAVVSSDRHTQKPKNSAAATAAQEHTKNLDHQRYKRAKLASKKIHHHIHEHHHYHHYDYYIV